MPARIRFQRTPDGYTVTVNARPVGAISYGESPADKADPRLRYSWNLTLPALGIHRGYSYQQGARRAAREALGDQGACRIASVNGCATMATDPSAPDLEAIRLYAQQAVSKYDGISLASWAVLAMLDQIDAQAARLAALEQAARAVCTAQSGAVWVAIVDLAAVLDAGTVGAGKVTDEQ